MFTLPVLCVGGILTADVFMLARINSLKSISKLTHTLAELNMSVGRFDQFYSAAESQGPPQ
jgi:fructose-specific phosphotransferase system IIC component